MRYGPQGMPSLRELQTRVMDALLSASAEGAAPLIDLPNETALSRLHVYGNNVRTNFVDGLHSSYPAIWRLVGEDYFRQIARQFHVRHPSRSGDLLHAGALFPGFLAELHPADEFRYLADVARLEWLIQEALLAADHAPLNLDTLAGVAPAAYDALRFELHPALRLFESPYPALRIWQVNMDDAEPEIIDLDCGADRVAVMRHQLRLNFHPLSQGEYRLLDALRRGEPFAASVDAGGANDVEFDASAALLRFVAIEAIVDFWVGIR
jgi:hypothetical protein